MTLDAGSRRSEIISGATSGGANTSHTILVSSVSALLSAVSPDGSADDYEEAAVQQNVLGKATDAARRRTYRYLREL